MPEVIFEGESYATDADESVLSCLERNGVEIPNSCRSGICHSCMLKGVSGSIPEASQTTVPETLRAQGYFLSCTCLPTDALHVARADGAMKRISARIVNLSTLNERVIRVELETDDELVYFPGQFANLILNGNVVRSYSLASVPALETHLECHVAIVPNGAMSGWLHHEASVGDTLELTGPLGNCFYLPSKPEQSMLLLGTGTGLAPLYGIARDALHQGHSGEIHLFHGALITADLYLVEELQALDTAHANFHFHPCVLRDATENWVESGKVDEIAMGVAENLKGWKVYLCGDPALVRTMQRKAFMSGASMSDILSDAFIPAGGATQ